MSRLLLIVTAVLLIQACATTPPATSGPTITMPLVPAWYEGERYYYITTEISQPDMATAMQVNYAPRLNDAVPDYPKPPELRTAIERVYAFPNKEQDNVLPSVPIPLGASSTDEQYSPLWLVYMVTWLTEPEGRVFKSENEVLDAADQGLVKIERTNVLVNCPVVATGDGTVLPGSVFNGGG